MYIPFDEMPNSSRIWIYQSNRKLENSEVNSISKELEIFCENWQAHSHNLKTSFDIKNNFFIVLAVDENQINASGCSIDSSVRKIKEIEEKHSISLLSKELLIFYLENEIKQIPLNCLKKEIKLKNINIESIFFNNLATSIEEMSTKWKVPVGTTWLKKYF